MARPCRVRTTDSRHDLPIAPNLLDRNFVAPAPNCAWLADITYVETDLGWLYLATVMDLYSRWIVGWPMAFICSPNCPCQRCGWPSPRNGLAPA
jgi:putative transposase